MPGRLAAVPEPTVGVAVRGLGDQALKAARARLGKRVALSNLLPEGLHVSGQERVLIQVLVNLVVEMPCRPSPTTTAMAGWCCGRRPVTTGCDWWSRTTVPRIEPEVLRRVFEPFFTTKPSAAEPASASRCRAGWW